MASETVETTTLGNTSSRSVGRVKWFNNKAGYGFITVNDGDRAGSDIFVHHSNIRVSDEQYKYLVQGEYVEFSVEVTGGGPHDCQAGGVSGINGGKLMCETRREYKSLRKIFKTSSDNEEAVPERRPRQSRPSATPRETPTDKSQSSTQGVRTRSRGSGPRDAETSEWNLVDKKTTRKPRSKAPPCTNG